MEWIKNRPLGIASLALTAGGQLVILLTVLFAPDAPIYERVLMPHWTDDLGSKWLILTLLGGALAILGLVLDKRRDIAGFALGAALIGFIWPWG